MKYYSDNPDSIEQLFRMEGDSLARHGIKKPHLDELDEKPEEYILPAAVTDPTGQAEYGPDGLRYTRLNAADVHVWRRQEAAGELGGTTIWRSLKSN